MNNDDNEKDIYKEKEKEDKDLTKALTFLLSKETEGISEEKKKEFLLQKIPSNIVNEAMHLYSQFQSKIEEKSIDYKSKGLFSSLYDLGILSTTVLVTLILNYLLDFNRDKKNVLFYQNAEERLSEQFEQRMNEMKDSINNSMNEYVKADILPMQISSHLDSYSQGKGLSINLSNNKIKQELSMLKTDLLNQKKEISALNDTIRINNTLLSQGINKEPKTIFDDYISQQDNTNYKIDTKDTNENKETQLAINDIITSIETNELQIQLFNELMTRFKAILEAYKSKNELIKLNISNTFMNQFNQDLIIKILTSSGLTKVINSNFMFQLDQAKVTNLQRGINEIETILNTLTSSN